MMRPRHLASICIAADRARPFMLHLHTDAYLPKFQAMKSRRIEMIDFIFPKRHHYE
jgi:hypothetical protein